MLRCQDLSHVWLNVIDLHEALDRKQPLITVKLSFCSLGPWWHKRWHATRTHVIFTLAQILKRIGKGCNCKFQTSWVFTQKVFTQKLMKYSQCRPIMVEIGIGETEFSCKLTIELGCKSILWDFLLRILVMCEPKTAKNDHLLDILSNNFVNRQTIKIYTIFQTELWSKTSRMRLFWPLTS